MTDLAALLDLPIESRFQDELPGDADPSNRRRQVEKALWTHAAPTAVAAPKLLAGSPECAEMLGLDPAEFASDDFARVFGGNALLPRMRPYAMAYGGHQFGHWAGQLGDGRAINLGDVVAPNGLRWTLQLKGAGPTPFSRSADGLAVLRSSLREFVCSEAMHHLGIPTTRALSLVTTGEQVMRDMFYDGNAQLEPGAIVCRVAPSFVRFGSFELPASRGDVASSRALADHVIRTQFPQLDAPPAPAPIPSATYVRWIEVVRDTSAEMVAHWQRVGFVHGVMNTDNMSILGQTIDYGPYGWLEGFDPGWTPNTTDAQSRRYVFGNQPQIVHWNLTRLASAIVPLAPDVGSLQDVVDGFQDSYEGLWHPMLARKLGLREWSEDDGDLARQLMDALQVAETDWTIFFRALADVAGGAPNDTLHAAFYDEASARGDAAAAIEAWVTGWRARLGRDGEAPEVVRDRMRTANPKYVFRNYLAQVAIDAAEKGDASEIERLLEVLRKPYQEQPEFERYAAKRPEWARHRPGCSMLSCSS